MRLELHCHSTCSDGSYSPEKVAHMAGERGVGLFCLTDHDTWAGYEATQRVLGDRCHVLRGVELSCREYNRSVHLLIYGLKDGPALEVLKARLDEVTIQRQHRIQRICERLRKLGIIIDTAALLARAEGRNPGRPDVAFALVEAGVCSSPREAFERFLHDGGPADVPIERFSVADGVALGRAAGARMSLAHPHTLGQPALVRDLFVRLRDAGLDGIEAFYGKYARAESQAWLRMARQLDLVPTGGSDFHGQMTPDISRPAIDLSHARVQRIYEWLELPSLGER